MTRWGVICLTILTSFFCSVYVHATDLSVDRMGDNEISFDFIKECKIENTDSSQIKRYGGNTGIASHNYKCDHEWALRNANSLNYIQEKYAQEVLKRFEDPAGGEDYKKDALGNFMYDKNGEPIPEANKIKYSSGDYVKLKESGVCSEFDDDVTGNLKSFDNCHSRWKREALKLSVHTHNETLENNKTRVDMSVKSEKDRIFAVEPVNQMPPKKSVLDDFYNLSKQDKNIKIKKNKRVFKSIYISEIKFDKNPIPAVEGKIKKSKMIKIDNELQRKKLALDKTNEIEVADDIQDENVANKLINHVNPVKNSPLNKSVFNGQKYFNDENSKELKVNAKLKKREDTIQVNVTDDQGNVTSSMTVFQKVMEDIEGGVQRTANGGKRMPANTGKSSLGVGGTTTQHAAPQVNNVEFKGSNENIDENIIKQLNSSSDPAE